MKRIRDEESSSTRTRITRRCTSQSSSLSLLQILLIVQTLSSLLTSTSSTPATTTRQTATHSKTIIAYYASWQWYDRGGLAKPSNLDMSKVTRYNFAFFQPDVHGNIYGTDSWADAIVLFGDFDWDGEGPVKCSWDSPVDPPACASHNLETGLIHLAHEAGVEVYPSIGGWTLSDNFPTLASTAEGRSAFANNCVRLIREYEFDGIDIDWEYPGYADHSGTEADTVNYSLFLKEIRDKLDELGDETGRFYGLTAALPCGPDLIAKIEVDKVKDYLTELNLMTYDFHGSWNAKTGVNAPLYDQEDSPDFSVHGCVNNWIKGGGTNDQINIGLPFYGRSFAGSGLTGLYQPFSSAADTITWSDDEGTPQYFNIAAKINQFTSLRDEQTMTQIAYGSSGLVSYDDERAICEKTEYAMEHDLNGYIIWEISGDIMPDLSTPLLDATNYKLTNPDVSCASKYGEKVVVETTAATTGEDAGVSETVNGNNNNDGVNPFYAHLSTGVCVNDGKQYGYLKDDQLYESIEKCCKGMFQWASDDCISASTNGNSAGRWYPSDGQCVSEGNVPAWIPEGKIFGTIGECCAFHFSWMTDCVPEGTTVTENNSPSPPQENEDESDATAAATAATTATTSTTTTTSPPTSPPTSRPTNELNMNTPTQSLFYPYYGEDGTAVECRNDGEFQYWFPRALAATSLGICCELFFLPNQVEQCKNGNVEYPYYPNFEDSSCVNDGNHPDYMVGDYLSSNKWLCCNDFFSSNSELLNKCTA